MPVEIERKFLLRSDAWRTQVERSQPMRQGYLATPGGKASVRVRVEGQLANLNIKAAVLGNQRAEYEYNIPLQHAEEMIESLCSKIIVKTRHHVRHDGMLWEIDEFHGDNAGLLVAEIELESVDQSFTKPQWLGNEVTDQKRYYNHSLSEHPYRTWNASGD